MALAATAGNVVGLPTAAGTPGEQVTLTVTLTNTDVVSAMQVQVPVDDGFAVVAGSETLSGRAADHSATVGVRDGMLNIMVWSVGMEPLAGDDGVVLSFDVTLGNEPKTIGLHAARVTLTDPAGNPVEGTATDGSLTILAPKVSLASREVDYGHIPIRSEYHRNLTVTNVGNAPLTVSGIDPSAAEFSSATPFPLVIAAGATNVVDVTYRPVERGAIVETVRLLSDNIAGTNTVRLTADPFAVNELHVADASGIADSTVTIHLNVNNMDALSGFQMEFDLPDQLRYVDGSFALTDRRADHNVVVTHNNGKLRAIAYSLADRTFSGEDGEIAHFDVVLSGRYGTTLRATKAVLTANYRGQDMDVLSDHYGGYVSIASPQLNATDRLDLGATPVTRDAEGMVHVYNGGGAPLRIDRVVFDREGFALTEATPMVIEPWRSVDLHVSYNGQEQASYEAWMQLYSNDPDHRLHNIRVTGSRYAPNFLAYTAGDVVDAANLQVSVEVSNYDPVEGLQFDIAYPWQWFTPTGGYTVTDRASGFSMTQRELSRGVMRCFVYSLGDGTIVPGEGTVLTMAFATAPDTPEGDYMLSITNIKAGTSALTDKYAGSTEQCRFAVTHSLPGDVNLDGKVDVTDVNILINIILGKDDASNYARRAYINDDDTVDISDANMLISTILGK